MAFVRVLTVALLAAVAQGSSQDSSMNPIRKVVTLLQAMQKKVTAEGEKEKDLYDKFMCYCKTGGSDLSTSISSAETKVPAVGAEITASEEKLEQSKADLKNAQVDRSAAEASMAEAKALREKEAAAYAGEKAEFDTNIAALTKAVAALEKGMAGSFLQSDAANVLRKVAVSKVEMLEADRQDLVAFLAQGSSYAPSSGSITGILKELGDEMSKSLADITANEEGSIKTCEALIAAKKKEMAALSETVEFKTAQIGELGVAIVTMKEDLTDTEAALAEDQAYFAQMEKSCKTKTAEWEERSKTRAEELVALADTIKVLNDDDAMDLFKKTLPGASASLVQVRVSASAERSQALSLIRAIHQKADKHLRPALDLIALVLSGKKAMNQGTFDKVIKMCDDMVVILKKEQLDDDNKKEYCNMQFDHTDDSKKALERKIADAETAIASAKEGIETTTQEIAALEAGIMELDKSVAEATEQRQAENVEYKELMASDGAAKEVLGFAKNRLNKFYNPKLYMAPPKQELSDEAPSFVQLQKAAPPPPPETAAAYMKKSEESGGCIAMMDLLVKDLEKEMTVAEAEEKNAQEDYETTMSDSATKRAADSKSLTDREAAKAEMQSALEASVGEKKSTTKELMATDQYIAALHAECDWLIQYYDVRKQARSDETDSLEKAKAVLSGADYSLLQRGSSSRLRKFLHRH
mmetsp:Transcript_96616/g.272801  ORF Transcript_96616/g.272801 Transcript_96616/m.272801 type:complete len:697 (-) Transcript_96616:60-2150(-)